MSNQIIRKPIKISWVAPNGKPYQDTINMSLEEYQQFVNYLLELKNKSKPKEEIFVCDKHHKQYTKALGCRDCNAS